MRCLKELEGLRVAKLRCFARRTSTRRPAQCGWRWSREGAKDAKRGCGNGRRLVWPGMCGIGSGGGVTEPCRRSGHPRHSPRRALESLQDAVGNAAPYRWCRRLAPQPPANVWEPSGFGEGDGGSFHEAGPAPGVTRFRVRGWVFPAHRGVCKALARG